jgi:TRAP-type C4-dicarboxylate transport system permease small subunit
LKAAHNLVRWSVVAGGIFAGVGIAAMMFVMAYEVFSRYLMNAPTYWALEVSTYLLVASTCLGLGYTLRGNAHVAVDIAVRQLSAPTRRLCQRLVMLLVVGFAMVMLIYGVKEVLSAMHYGEHSLTPLAMPLAIPLSAVPIGALLLALQAIEFIVVPPPDLIDPETELMARAQAPVDREQNS